MPTFGPSTLVRMALFTGRLDNGNEQFFYCTSKVAESYHAMHRDDLQKWFTYFRTRCKCN
jgi:hypothetical protein